MINLFKKIFIFTNKVRVIILNLLFWIIIFLAVYYGRNNIEEIPQGETLLIQPGIISDSVGEEKILSLLSYGKDDLPYYTVLDDILFALEDGAYNSDISQVVLDLDSLDSVGYASAEEIGKALDNFKKSGKKVYAYSSFYDQSKYYLASFADSISMDPYGELSIDGIGVYRNYWKDLLDKYDIDVSVFRAGEYKSYVEPYLSNVMSDEVKKQNLSWMGSIWNGFINDIQNNRNLKDDLLEGYFSNRSELLRIYNGDNGTFSNKVGFIDKLETRFDFFNNFDNFYNLSDYVSANRISGRNNIGVINLEGTITYGDNSPGSVSAADIELVLDSFFNDERNFKGLLVRINSGGGGVFASEIIRRKISYISEYVPVVISMGDVTASGGYWIATAGDVIFADKRTITGSIGVFGMVYGFEETLKNNFGINNDGVSTTPYADNPSFTKNISKESGEIFQLSVDNTYNNFVKLISESRGLDLQEVKDIAGGRVWSGEQALEIGLADYIGGLSEAKDFFIDELGTDSLTFTTLEGESSIFEQLYTELTSVTSLPSLKVIEEVTLFDRINDSKNIYAIWY